MAKSVEDRGRGARPARRDEGAYCWYVTEEQRSRPGCIGREIDRLSHSRALSSQEARARTYSVSSASVAGANDGVCTLPEAVDAINSVTGKVSLPSDCLAPNGGDVVVLGDGGYYLETSIR